MRRASRCGSAYAGLLLLQTTSASCILWVILPIFRQMISRLGEPQELEPWRMAAIVGSVVVLQASYWWRFRCVAIHVPLENVLVGHLLLFASRTSFFFAGAFFSVIFFRHVPELASLPPLAQGLAKVLVVLAILFSLFCYSLELERLGKAIGNTPAEGR